MNIEFHKISKIPFPFKVSVDQIELDGFLKRKNENLIELNAVLKGSKEHICDRCGSEFQLSIDEKIELILSNGIYKDENHKILDVIEIFDETINLNEILQSELEAYLSDYLYCDSCKN